MHRRRTPGPAVAGHRPLLLALALAAAFTAPRLQAQPAGMAAFHGSATITQSGSTTTVTTTNGGSSNHSVLNWQSFNVPGGTTTHFAQPGATSTSINRVVAANPSSILGNLTSNGHLVLVNPYGIAVGAGASIDTAGFTASTIRMTDADALAGVLRFAGNTEAGRLLQVDGQILARQGDVVLIGPNVQAGATATLQSLDGAVILAAGQQVKVTGRGLEGIVFELQAPADQALNLGTLKGDAVGIFAGTLRHSGLIRAEAVGTAGGKVVLRAATSMDTASGSSVVADGSVDIRADGGGVRLSGAVSAGTDMLVSAKGSESLTGRVEIDAPVSAQRLALVADGSDAAGVGIGQSASGAIDAGELILGSSNGSAVLTNPANRIGSLAASVAALDLVTTTELLSIGNRLGNAFLERQFDGLESLSTARIDVRAPEVLPVEGRRPLPAGSIRIEADSKVEVGALTLKAAGDIVARPQQGDYLIPATRLQTWGADPAGTGFVDLQAGGDIHVGDIATQPPLRNDNLLAAVSEPSGGVAGGSVRLKAGGSISTGSVTTDAPSGYDSVGQQAGWIHIEAGDGIAIHGDLSARGAGGYAKGGSGNTVSLSAGGGGILVTGGIDTSGGDVYGSGSLGGGGGRLVDLSASGAIAVTGTIRTQGGYGAWGSGGDAGEVHVTSSAGAVQLHAIEAGGGDGSLGGGSGGLVQLGAHADLAVGGPVSSAGGSALLRGTGGDGKDVLASAGGALSIAEIDTSGGSGGGAGGTGGNGGDIELTGGTRVQLAVAYAAGGSGGHGGAGVGGDGGDGGTVRLTQSTGDLDLSGVFILAGGGEGGSGGTTGGDGGDGGDIHLTASQGGVITSGFMGDASGTYFIAGGGEGGHGYGTAATARGGQGGHSGDVTIKAAGPSRLEGGIAAYGGSGGGVNADGAGVGGQGGDGGHITLELTQPGAELLLAGSLYVGEGHGGLPQQESASTSEPSRIGASGTAGSLTTLGGRMRIQAPPSSGELTPTSAHPGGFVLPSWTNRSNVVVASGLNVLAPQVRNFGTLELEADAVLQLGRYEYSLVDSYAPPAFLASGQPLVNEATGVLRGHGTVDGSVRNRGTLAPGNDAVPIGAFTILGDLVQEGGSRLQIDAYTGVPFQPGLTYDQVRVSGVFTAGGVLQVAGSPAPAPAGGSQSQALAAAFPTSPGTTDRLEVLAAAVLASGSTFAALEAPADLSGSVALRIGTPGALQEVPVAAPPPPSPPPVASPAPTPAPSSPPAVAPGTSVAGRILEILGANAPAGLVEQVLTQQNSVVTQFLSLLVAEERQQALDREREGEAQGDGKIDRKRGDIVSTDTQCKPS